MVNSVLGTTSSQLQSQVYSAEQKKSAQKTVETTSPKVIEAQNDLAKKLIDMMNDKTSGSASQDKVTDFVNNLKSSLDSDQGMMVDRKA
ncbi:MAG: hypothetical protein WCJ01_00480 [Ignavibacteria bacterium]